MKKSLIVSMIALITAFTANVNAQTGCTELPSTTLSTCVPPALPEPGLSPVDDSLDCLVQGQFESAIINFQNFTSIGPVSVEWLRLDSLTNLPCGLGFALNEAPGYEYQSGENGCMSLVGTVTSGPGIYKLGIYVTVKVSALPNPISGEAGSLSAQFSGPPFDYYVRVKADANDPCPDLPVSINEVLNVSSFSVTPNPVKSTAEVRFSLEKTSNLKVVVYNSVGQMVYQSDVQGVTGENRVAIDRGSFHSGLYLVGLEQNGKNLISKQIIVE